MTAKRKKHGPSARRFRRAGALWSAPLVLTLVACSSSGGATPDRPVASKAPGTQGLKVTSTLSRHAILPHRIHWQAFPSVPAADVSEVDFLIDGRLGWVERNTPYFYGSDGNWLVTSFLTPGAHTFTVRVITVAGHTATDTVRASVTAPPAPPAILRRITWARQVAAADVRKPASGRPLSPGRWRLRIGPAGWRLHGPAGEGLLFDVGYGPAGRLRMRPAIAYPPYPNGNNGGFCGETDPSWTWTYSVGDGGRTLTLRPLGHDPCADRIAILAGTWTRTF